MSIFALTGLSVGISCAVLSAIIGIFARTRLHRVLLLFNLVVALWGFGLFLVGTAGTEHEARNAWRVAHLGGYFVGPVFFHLTTLFCGLNRKKVLLFAYFQAAVFLILSFREGLIFRDLVLFYDIYFLEVNALYLAALSAYLVLVAMSFFELIRFLPKARGRKRSQTIYVTSGFMVGFAGATTMFLPMFHIKVFYPLGNLGITLYCFILTYAILRHRLLDIHVALKKSLVYSLSAGILAGLFIAIVLGMSRVLSPSAGLSPLTITAVSAVSVAFLFPTLRNGVQLLVDRLFYRESYDYYSTVSRIGQRLFSTMELDKICTLVVDVLADVFKARRALLFSLRGSQYEISYARPKAPGSPTGNPVSAAALSADAEVVRFLKEAQTVVREDLEDPSNRRRANAAAAELESYQGETITAIKIDAEPVYLLILGEKQSREPFSAEDIHLLNAVAHQAAIALKNAALYTNLREAHEQLQHQIAARQNAESSLRQAAEDWQKSFDTIKDAITLHDTDFNILRANKAAVELLGLPPETIFAQKCFRSYHGTECPPEGCPSCETLKTGRPAKTELFEPYLEKALEIKALPRLGKDGEITGLIHIVQDITDRRKADEEREKLQAQLTQAQKMESVGRLAGGVAHDFNNLLTTILGYSELSLKRLPSGDAMEKPVRMIKEAGEKAAALTGQLLAFSRRQVLEVKAVNLVSVVANMGTMLSRTIGENIEMTVKSSGRLRPIHADPVQIEQVIMNLVLNARDAMPEGGKLVIETTEVTVDAHGAEDGGRVTAGDYALLSVSDTGEGMSLEVQEKIFEPFYTTKEIGKGTGLGLATVYGVVKQHHGYIFASSAPARGTTFRVYFPVVDEEEEPVREEERIQPESAGRETILVVDDEPAIRRFIVDVFQPLGYTLLEAGNGREALHEGAHYQGRIDLLLTDVIMPGIGVRTFVKRFRQERPETAVLYMSGYSDDVVEHHGGLEPGSAFIQKPLTPGRVLGKVRQVLEEKGKA